MINWWKRRTLRVRLAVWYGVVGAALLAGFSATLFFYVSNRMAQPLDHQLQRDLAEIRQKLSVRGRTLQWEGRDLSADAAWSTDYPWFELWDEHGILVRRLWPFAENRVQLVPSAPARGRETLSVFRVAPDLRLRVLNVPYQAAGQEAEWMLRAMRVHEPVADALGALRWIILLSLPVVIVLLVSGGYYLTRRWLMPLDWMARDAARISAADLSRRLSIDNPEDELGRMARVFNETLDRLEQAFGALDRFATDASHELRTPLATQRSVGEVGLQRSRTTEQYREIIASMLEESRRLELLINRLLELAAAEGGNPAVHRVPVAVGELVHACVSDLAVLAEAREQTIQMEVGDCAIESDPVILRQALQNLIDNAIKYSPPHSPIKVTMEVLNGGVEIAVTDRGPGIDPANRARLAERFFRPERSAKLPGFGLGLSITKAYMKVLGGELRVEPAEPHGSRFVLRLPLTAPGAIS